MNPSSRVLRPIFICALILFVAGLTLAKDGPDFHGSYHIGEVSDLGEEVRVQLTFRIFNQSGADVVGATITLEDRMLPKKEHGSLSPVDIRAGESERLSGWFTVPRREYEHWEKGAAPQLRIDCKDPSGKQARQRVPLVPMPVPEEG